MKRLVVLITTTVFALPALAFATDGPWTEFERLRQGTPPTVAVGPDFDQVKQKLTRASREFARIVRTQARRTSAECTEFSEVTQHLALNVAATMDHFKDPSWATEDGESTLARSRLQLILPLFQVLRGLFAQGRDGGFGVIDLRPTQTCAYFHRTLVQDAMTDYATQIETFRQAALGTPGVLPLERLTDQLLLVADQQQTRFDNTSLILHTGTFITTLALWNAAPAWALAKFGSGFVKKFAFLVVLGIAESVTYEALDYFVNPAPAQRERPQIPSFGEMLRDIRDLVDSSFNQPQVYLAHLTVTQAQLSALVGAWVQSNQDELTKLVKP